MKIKYQQKIGNSKNKGTSQHLYNCTQYLNCKISHGGTLLHPSPNAFGMRKYFSEDYVIPSSKLNENKKIRSSPEIEVVFRQN